MQLKDRYCVICGCYLDQSLNRVGGEWLRNVMVITDEENVIMNGSIILGRSNAEYRVDLFDDFYWLDPKNYKIGSGGCALGMHEDCYKCIEKYLKHKIRFADLIPIVDMDTGIAPSRYYPVANKYQGPSWEMADALWDWDDDYLYSSPIGRSKSSVENRKRIIKVWEKPVNRMKKRELPNHPSGVAEMYKSGTVRLGNDGNKWKVYGGKWKKM